MATYNSIHETATGNLLKAGFVPFIAGAGETLRTDVPYPGKVYGDRTSTNFHRWNGSAWIEVAHTEGDYQEANGIPALFLGRRIVLNFTTGQSGDVVPYAETDNDVYAVVSSFIFDGADTTGIPTNIRVVVWRQTATAGTNNIKLVRKDTGVSIATLDFTNEVETIYNMTILGNLPVDQQLLEIQMISGQNNRYSRVSSILIEWN